VEYFDIIKNTTKLVINFRFKDGKAHDIWIYWKNRRLVNTPLPPVRTEGSWIKRAFDYQFRLWNIADVRECLLLAGFKRAEVYLSENLLDQENFSDYTRVPRNGGPVAQMDSWNAYVVGIK